VDHGMVERELRKLVEWRILGTDEWGTALVHCGMMQEGECLPTKQVESRFVGGCRRPLPVGGAGMA
jgi:hypothetical protein